jgi:serine/threonine protein kinase
MGVVYGAMDVALGRPVALKLLDPERSLRWTNVARFLREAKLAASLTSEHVVRIYDVTALPNGAPLIVMERLRGMSLDAFVRACGPLPVPLACDLLLHACEALGEAHGAHIVHRDLKPSNLFVTERQDGSSKLKVLDFGISKALDDAQNLTATGVVMGSPRYMPPEQLRSLREVDWRGDIWALGAVLFEMLTGAPAFQAASATELCMKIANDPPLSLRALRPDAPAGLEEIIVRCLHKDAAGRYQDIASLAEALGPVASARARMSVARIRAMVESGRALAAARIPSSPEENAWAEASRMAVAAMAPTLTASTEGDGNPVVASPSTVPLAPPLTPRSANPPPLVPVSSPQYVTHPPPTVRTRAPTIGLLVAALGVGVVLLVGLGAAAAWFWMKHR